MNRLSNDARSQVVACLCEGNSIRATVRITGVSKKTVARLGVELGEACEKFRIHSSLRITPAMAAGLTDHVWELSEIVGLLEREEALALAA
jgi:transposase